MKGRIFFLITIISIVLASLSYGTTVVMVLSGSVALQFGAILMETADFILMETGFKILQEGIDALLTEANDYILMETGDQVLLET